MVFAAFMWYRLAVWRGSKINPKGVENLQTRLVSGIFVRIEQNEFVDIWRTDTHSVEAIKSSETEAEPKLGGVC